VGKGLPQGQRVGGSHKSTCVSVPKKPDVWVSHGDRLYLAAQTRAWGACLHWCTAFAYGWTSLICLTAQSDRSSQHGGEEDEFLASTSGKRITK